MKQCWGMFHKWIYEKCKFQIIFTKWRCMNAPKIALISYINFFNILHGVVCFRHCKCVSWELCLDYFSHRNSTEWIQIMKCIGEIAIDGNSVWSENILKHSVKTQCESLQARIMLWKRLSSIPDRLEMSNYESIPDTVVE